MPLNQPSVCLKTPGWFSPSGQTVMSCRERLQVPRTRSAREQWAGGRGRAPKWFLSRFCSRRRLHCRKLCGKGTRSARQEAREQTGPRISEERPKREVCPGRRHGRGGKQCSRWQTHGLGLEPGRPPAWAGFTHFSMYLQDSQPSGTAWSVLPSASLATFQRKLCRLSGTSEWGLTSQWLALSASVKVQDSLNGYAVIFIKYLLNFFTCCFS